MTFDVSVTTEVSDRIAEIGRAPQAQPTETDPRYNSPEGVLFRKALALIADERKWLRGMYSCDGRVCSLGAINKASAGHPYIVTSHRCGAGSAVRRALEFVVPRGHIATFNDTHTHAEVIAAWHCAGHANGWL